MGICFPLIQSFPFKCFYFTAARCDRRTFQYLWDQLYICTFCPVTSIFQLFKLMLGIRFIEFFTFDYDSLPITFQSGIAFFPLVALDKIPELVTETQDFSDPVLDLKVHNPVSTIFRMMTRMRLTVLSGSSWVLIERTYSLGHAYWHPLVPLVDPWKKLKWYSLLLMKGSFFYMYWSTPDADSTLTKMFSLTWLCIKYRLHFHRLGTY